MADTTALNEAAGDSYDAFAYGYFNPSEPSLNALSVGKGNDIFRFVKIFCSITGNKYQKNRDFRLVRAWHGHALMDSGPKMSVEVTDC